jgi:hypothetical protein
MMTAPAEALTAFVNAPWFDVRRCQERLLAPRVLLFSLYEPMFACNVGQMCE